MRSDNGNASFIEVHRRAQIVAAATQTIHREGFARASLARIAEHAGISKGVILYHFASKDELIRAVVTDTYSDAGALIATAVEAAVSHRDRLAAYVGGNVAFLAEHRVEVHVLNEIFTSFRGADGRLAYDETQLDSVLEPLEILLRAGQDDGELRDFDTRVVARTIRATIDALTPQLVADPELDVDAYRLELVELIDRAVRS